MKTVDSVQELEEIISFVHKFKTFVDKYGEWLFDFPPGGENLVDRNMDLIDTLWYLDKLVYLHYHCDDCGFTCKLDDFSRYLLRCKCGGKLIMCTYLPPTDRCNFCKERFKCLTENKNFEIKLVANNLVSKYKIIKEGV